MNEQQIDPGGEPDDLVVVSCRYGHRTPLRTFIAHGAHTVPARHGAGEPVPAARRPAPC